ncbi:phospholipase D family protein [Franzmannia qiaohouensis]|uniref:Phospholipase D family protein n=1 Tax=Franzmannia qiaohouensis TaxID=1329370 RepID=A0ABU1HIS6_9GAMM|nr:phospholipase D family protein [Halomonas qiaohouensis]MDR5907196.1 phospholipase D family protein [Halomonas qiaohouensis]
MIGRARSGARLVLTSLLVACLLLAGCAPVPVARSHSWTLPLHESEATALGGWVADQQAQQAPEQSGFRLLVDGDEAFALRAALLARSERSLDVQTYIADDGLTSRVLLVRMLDAAERGVRVRLLLDDLASLNNEALLVAIDSHPQVEVRLFNPLLRGRGTLLSRGVMMAADLRRQHRRMHNKLWLSDGAVAITGGRNLGDEYFNADEQRNFADLDLLAVGPVARDLSRSFDDYWRHHLALPLARFRQAEPGAWRELRDDLAAWLEEQRHDSPYLVALRQRFAETSPGALLAPLTWAPGQALWDPPGKLAGRGRPALEETLSGELVEVIDELEQRLLIISAYFIPTPQGAAQLQRLARDGVEVAVITNSLEATDVPPVHGAYAGYRPALLESGVRLYELRADHQESASLGVPGASSSSLHIKALGFDRERLFVGSYNIDPRSIWWNSEVGVLVESQALNRELWALAELGMSPALSYAVGLDEAGGLEWHTDNADQPEVLRREPGSWLRRLGAWSSRALRLEDWL